MKELPSSGFHCSMCNHIKAELCTLECSCCCSLDTYDEYEFWDEPKKEKDLW